jgi:hypothetical protein
MTISRSRSVNPGQQLADAAAGEHRHRDLPGVRLVGAGLDEGFQFLGLHGFRGHYRLTFPDP